MSYFTLSRQLLLWTACCLISPTLVLAQSADTPPPAPDAKKAEPAKAELPEPAKRLGITEPTKTSKFKRVKAKVGEKEREYDLVVDEKAALEAGYTPEEIERALKEAMDSRTDELEDNEITIEIDKKPDKSAEGEAEAKSSDKKSEAILVGKIKKTVKPGNARQSEKPAIKETPLDNERVFRTRAQGACEKQNEQTRDAVKFPNPA